MKVSSVSVSMAAVAILAGGIALWPANAQPTGSKPAGDQPPAGGRPATPGPRGGDRGGEPPSEWREKLKDELREHPRLGRALLALHEARDYLDKAPNEFGGHKKSAIESIDNSIKELVQAIKFDEKREPPKDRPARGEKPSGDKPAPTTTPANP